MRRGDRRCPMGYACADCGLGLGFDPADPLHRRVLRYHQEVACPSRRWVEWRRERRLERARRHAEVRERNRASRRRGDAGRP